MVEFNAKLMPNLVVKNCKSELKRPCKKSQNTILCGAYYTTLYRSVLYGKQHLRSWLDTSTREVVVTQESTS